MDPAVAVTIFAVVLIVAALALFLIATILELRKIAKGLDVVLQGVGELVTKTAPVNGVLDAINGTLVTGRNLLEGLFLKKAGEHSAGLVESCFPGEGSRFLQRVGRHGTVTHIGEEFPPGAATLAALVAATRGEPAPAPAPAAAATAAPAAPAAPAERIVVRSRDLGPAEGGLSDAPSSEPGRVTVRGARPWEEGSVAAPSAPPPQAAPAPPPPAAAPAAPAPSEAPPAEPARVDVRGARPWEGSEAPPAEPGRVNVRGARPWEGGSAAAPSPAPAPPPAAPAPPPQAPADAGGGDESGGRLNVRGSRPWES